MKKKILVMVMASVMTFALAACGDKIAPAENVTEDVAVEAATEATVEEAAEAEATEEVSAEASTEASSAEASSAEASEEETDNAEFSSGTINGNVYENEFFNIRITVPDTYTFLSDEQISQITGQAADLFEDNKAVANSIENGTAAIVAYAVDGTTGANNVNVTLQSNASVANAIYNESSIMAISLTQLKGVLESQGAEISDAEIVKEEVAGEEHSLIHISGKINGLDFTERVVNIQKGDYMMAVAATTFMEDNTEAIFAGIEAIEE